MVSIDVTAMAQYNLLNCTRNIDCVTWDVCSTGNRTSPPTESEEENAFKFLIMINAAQNSM